MLAPSGTGSATFALPPGSSAAFAGATLHHAFLVLDLSVPKVAFASNALPLALAP